MNDTQPELNFAAPPRSAFPVPRSALPPEVHTIIGYLHTHCRGPQRVSSAKTIAAFMGLKGADPSRHVRHLIELHMERFPFIIVGVPGKGYYVTDDPEAMAHYEATLHSLLVSAARKIKTFRRLAATHGYTRTGHAPHTFYSRRTTTGDAPA